MSFETRDDTAIFQKNLDLLRTARQQTLAIVAGLSQHEFDEHPYPSKWSIGEVLDHLLLFDRFLIQDISRLIDAARSGQTTAIRHSFSDVNVAPAFFPKELLPLMEIPFTLSSMFVPSCLRDALARSRLIRFQHPDIANPRRGRPAEQLRHELRASIETVEELLFDNSDVDFRKLHVEHPLLGDNNVVQLLSFMAAHEQHHQRQIGDLIRFQDSLLDAMFDLIPSRPQSVSDMVLAPINGLNFVRATRQFVPSSRYLVEAMVDSLPLAQAEVAVEFGPGTGVMTRELLKRLPAHAKLLAFEINPRFVRQLRMLSPDPRLEVLEAGAETVGQALRQRHLSRVDAVVSSLGLTIMPEPLKQAVFQALMPFLDERSALLFGIESFDSLRLLRGACIIQDGRLKLVALQQNVESGTAIPKEILCLVRLFAMHLL